MEKENAKEIGGVPQACQPTPVARPYGAVLGLTGILGGTVPTATSAAPGRVRGCGRRSSLAAVLREAETEVPTGPAKLTMGLAQASRLGALASVRARI